MADVELVIKISEKVYNALTHIEFDANLVTDEMRKSIANGTPLPKGHGRLIDADEFEELFGKMCPGDCGACDPKSKTDGRGRWYDTCSLIDDAQTVIEADTESEDNT